MDDKEKEPGERTKPSKEVQSSKQGRVRRSQCGELCDCLCQFTKWGSTRTVTFLLCAFQVGVAVYQVVVLSKDASDCDPDKEPEPPLDDDIVAVIGLALTIVNALIAAVIGGVISWRWAKRFLVIKQQVEETQDHHRLSKFKLTIKGHACGIDSVFFLITLAGIVLAEAVDISRVHTSKDNDHDLFIASRVFYIASHLVLAYSAVGINITDLSASSGLSSDHVDYVKMGMAILFCFNTAWAVVDTYQQTVYLDNVRGSWRFFVIMLLFPFLINFRIALLKFFLTKMIWPESLIWNVPRATAPGFQSRTLSEHTDLSSLASARETRTHVCCFECRRSGGDSDEGEPEDPLLHTEPPEPASARLGSRAIPTSPSGPSGSHSTSESHPHPAQLPAAQLPVAPAEQLPAQLPAAQLPAAQPAAHETSLPQ